jgi:hypothetical protein
MRPHVVVILTPGFDLLSRIIEREEYLLVQGTPRATGC